MNKYEANRNTVVKTIRFTKDELNQINALRGNKSFSAFMKECTTGFPYTDTMVKKCGDAYLDMKILPNTLEFSKPERVVHASLALAAFYNEAVRRGLCVSLKEHKVEKSDD